MEDARIIVVEDDADLREQTVAYLALSGFYVVGVGSATELYQRLALEDFTIMVLDLRLPDEDGLAVALHVRPQRNIGIIMATARGASSDRTRGFDSGADIYMPKPVDLAELVAAARSLTRRLGLNTVPGTAAPPSTTVEDVPYWNYDLPGFSLTAPNGRSARLTANEVSLMTLFKSRGSAVVSRGELLSVLGYDPTDSNNRNLDAAIRRLRLKVEGQTSVALPVQTIHTVGYVFEQEIRSVES